MGPIVKLQIIKQLLSAILDKRSVITFLVKKQNGPQKIDRRPKVIYGNGAIKQTKVY
jgi:hypothetical protein